MKNYTRLYLISTDANPYRLADGADCAVKIGISNYPKGRMNQLQTGSYKKLFLIDQSECYSATTAKRLEATLHAYFHQFRASGEWFALPRKLHGRRTLSLLQDLFRCEEDIILKKLADEDTLFKKVHRYGHDSEDTFPPLLNYASTANTSHYVQSVLDSLNRPKGVIPSSQSFSSATQLNLFP